MGWPEMATLLAQARTASVQASSPSAQIKAAVPQVGDRNWNWRKHILCPTIRVFGALQAPFHAHVAKCTVSSTTILTAETIALGPTPLPSILPILRYSAKSPAESSPASRSTPAPAPSSPPRRNGMAPTCHEHHVSETRPRPLSRPPPFFPPIPSHPLKQRKYQTHLPTLQSSINP